MAVAVKMRLNVILLMFSMFEVQDTTAKMTNDQTDFDVADRTSQGFVKKRNNHRRGCWNHKGYENRNQCLSDCSKKMVTLNNSCFPCTYKVLHLNKTEYDIQGGMLHVRSPLGNNRIIFQNEEYEISKNGTAYMCLPLALEFINCQKWTIEPTEYEILNNGILKIFVHNTEHNVQDYFTVKNKDAVVCISSELREAYEPSDTILIVPWIISTVSLVMILIFAFIFPKLNLRQNVILLCHIPCLLVAYFILIVRWIKENNFPNISCTAINLLQQYAFLTAFCWISVQSFDLWRRFVRPPTNQALRVVNKKKIAIYCLYSFGLPFLFILVTLSLEVANIEEFKPFEDGQCWFQNDKVALLLFYGPIAVILVANLFFFAFTIYQLHQMGKNVSTVNKQINHQM